MSHLSILPTVLRDEEVLATTLVSLGHQPLWGGEVLGFAGERQPVVLQVALAQEATLGWQRQADGSLAVVGDLQRFSRSQSTQQLLGLITRTYAAQLALREVREQFAQQVAQAQITVAV